MAGLNEWIMLELWFARLSIQIRKIAGGRTSSSMLCSARVTDERGMQERLKGKDSARKCKEEELNIWTRQCSSRLGPQRTSLHVHGYNNHSHSRLNQSRHIVQHHCCRHVGVRTRRPPSHKDHSLTYSPNHYSQIFLKLILGV